VIRRGRIIMVNKKRTKNLIPGRKILGVPHLPYHWYYLENIAQQEPLSPEWFDNYRKTHSYMDKRRALYQSGIRSRRKIVGRHYPHGSHPTCPLCNKKLYVGQMVFMIYKKNYDITIHKLVGIDLVPHHRDCVMEKKNTDKIRYLFNDDRLTRLKKGILQSPARR